MSEIFQNFKGLFQKKSIPWWKISQEMEEYTPGEFIEKQKPQRFQSSTMDSFGFRYDGLHDKKFTDQDLLDELGEQGILDDPSFHLDESGRDLGGIKLDFLTKRRKRK